MDRSQEKRKQLEEALEQGVAMIHLDARRPGVRVPAPLLKELHLRLNISFRFDPADLTVNDWGVRETLSFNGSRFKVGIPWQAIFGITAQHIDQAWIYPDDMPEELLAAAAMQAEASAAEGDDDEEDGGEDDVPFLAPEVAPAAVREKPRFRVVETASEAAEPPPASPPGPAATDEPSPEPPPPSPEGPGERRGHLRLVK